MESVRLENVPGMCLLSESMKDQEATVEGAIHSIRNMGDVAFCDTSKKKRAFSDRI